ncbi:MAG TPA: amidohydrolase family protein [Kiloniellales bacterium]|jgi:predicted TIM-barrel fold metal-dependent hydrolase|nr:amidohydrolase family protein [Kiloniellales bacterium]
MSETEDSHSLPVVDAHQHFWDLQENYYPWLCDRAAIPFRYGDYSAIRRTYLPADYRNDSGAFNIVGTVHIEAEHDPSDPLKETRWLEGLAESEKLPSACVAQAWLDRPDVEEILAAQARSRLIRGIRHKPRSAATPGDARRGEPGSMDCPLWRQGFALLHKYDLSFDLQTPWWHLEAAADLGRDFPQTQIIINHTALPADRSEAGLAAWRKALEQVAELPNIAMKISGLGRPGLPWSVEANGPIIRDAIAIMGVTRCMFASNYPVDSLVGSFQEIYSGFFSAVSDFSPAAQRALFHDNAVRLYRL